MEGVTHSSPLGNRIINIVRENLVSDFFITVNERVAYRKNGEIVLDDFVYNPETELKVTPGTEDYAMQIGGLRFRVNKLVTRGRLRWILRLLPSEIPSPEQTNLPPQALKAYLEAKNGLFLICGATGSGKSTTIVSMIKARAEVKKEHIITFEDPIEYILPTNLKTLVSQREIGSDELDFSASLRAALRQAPDVIMVGEIRDAETAEIALQASETGHVVIATMHTSSASSTVQRFINLIPTDRSKDALASFASSIKLILCQQLLYDANKSSRFPVHEILLPYDSVTNVIARGEFTRLNHELETGVSKGMMSFEDSIKVRKDQGWESAAPVKTGYTPKEVSEYFRKFNEENNKINSQV